MQKIDINNQNISGRNKIKVRETIISKFLKYILKYFLSLKKNFTSNIQIYLEAVNNNRFRKSYLYLHSIM